MFPKIFIIILNFNSRGFILDTLKSVFASNYPNQELVLVDNGSGDGSLELARGHYPKATFIKNEENLGFAAGNNIGIKYALERGADYILLLNHDIEAEKNFLFPLAEAFKKNEKLGIASPLIFKNKNNKVWFSGGEIDWFRMRSNHKTKFPTEESIFSEFITGCAMMIKKEVFKKIGLLDEKFFLYWEDADFSARAKKAGYQLGVFPESRIIHWEKSNEANFLKTYWLVLSGLIFFQKNTPLWFKPWIFFYVILRRIKNRFDLKKDSNNSSARLVRRAYNDFIKTE